MSILERFPLLGRVGVTALPVLFMSNSAIATAKFNSNWVSEPRMISARFDQGWSESRSVVRLDHGWLFARNDKDWLYLLIDLTGDTFADKLQQAASRGDLISVSFDVDLNRKISPKRDVAFGQYPGSYRLGRQLYLGPGRFTGLQVTKAKLAAGFGKTPALADRHRIWEMAIPLKEIGAQAGGQVRLGLQTNSARPAFSEKLPANYTRDFGKLIELQLAGPPFSMAAVALKPGAVRQVLQQSRRIIVWPGAKEPPLQEGMSVGSVSEPGLTMPPGCILPEGKPVKRVILPGGIIELHYANGSKKRRINGGWKTLCSDGKEAPTMVLHSTQIPPTLPPTLPDQTEMAWLQYHSNGLLNIISNLVHAPEMVDNYLSTEPQDMTVYEQIQTRRETIDYLMVE